ncbi:MAG: phosphoribosylformylglycinamidine cyclo-ligase [Planctomycetota bacterium]
MGQKSGDRRSGPVDSGAAAGDGLTYAGSGVDIEAGDAVVDRIKGHMRRTYGPRVLGRHGAFAGMLRLDYNEALFSHNYREPVLVACTDGVGTKVLLAVETGRIDGIGRDCVAMNVNDLIVQGAEPVLFLDYVGVHRVEPAVIERIVKGVAEGCELAGCALLGGETAEMADVYDDGEFDLAGFSVGVVELSRAVENDRAEPGDVVIGLGSSGVHSNGYSLVRAVIKKARLKLDRVYPELDEAGVGKTLGEVLLEPTRIYARPIVSLLRGYKRKRPIAGMAHITGGGLPGNVNRALPADVDAVIDTKAWAVPPVFRFLQAKGKIADEEMWKVFNMGIGYTLIVRPHFAEAVMAKLRRKGEAVYRIGKIVKGKGQVRLK